jgi:hypothetical protein
LDADTSIADDTVRRRCRFAPRSPALSLGLSRLPHCRLGGGVVKAMSMGDQNVQWPLFVNDLCVGVDAQQQNT